MMKGRGNSVIGKSIKNKTLKLHRKDAKEHKEKLREIFYLVVLFIKKLVENHMNENEISYKIIGAAIEVHRILGPGLLESAYEECLAYELSQRDLPFERQKPVAVSYKDVQLDCGFRLGLLVGGLVVVELKAVEKLVPIHQAQMLTYLKLQGAS